VPRVAGAASDPDFLASLPLSPFTGVQAEGAVLSAAGGLAIQATTWEAVAVISATVVTTYRLAEDALTRAAEGLKAAGSLAVLFGGVVIGAKVAVDSFVAGFGDEFVESLVPGLLKTLDEYRESPERLLGGGALFGALFGANIASRFEMKDAFAHAILRTESSLGATGPFYDDILRALIASGNTLGFFVDRPAKLGPSGLSAQELARRTHELADNSSKYIYGTGGALDQDSNGRILPSDVVSLLASGRQIDGIGLEDFATIRIITCRDDAGRPLAYTVQIPSTQTWLPWRVNVPNDLTANLHAMGSGEQTALAHSVLTAMEANGIRAESNGLPILMTGFSLGGITAAAIASESTGYNIRQVLTAGSPIASFDVPADVSVLALEAFEDPVCALDGKQNPSTWTTVRDHAARLGGEPSALGIGPETAHNLDRYARMAANLREPIDREFARYFSGHITIDDYYVKDGSK
jgi:hypothetical protein